MKLEISGLSKSYKDIPVLQDISLHLDGISSLGIIGASGCGKSTLLRHLAGIESPTKGEITINDCSPIEDKRAFQGEIGYVFQSHHLFPHLSLKDNLLLILEKVKKLPHDRAMEKVNSLFEKLVLLEVADKKPWEVSGGQAQRASIARALATEPQLIFLDEPTASLDPLLTKEVLSAVSSLRDSGIDFIFVTHEIAFLKQFADHVIFMHEGKIWEEGSIDCLTSPKTEELQKFLAASQ